MVFARSAVSARLFVCILTLLVLRSARAGDDRRGFVDRVYRDDAGEHKYVVFVPHDYTPDRHWPVILFLHSAADRGNDGRAPTEVGIGPAVRDRERTFPAIVVFPQCEDRDAPARGGWLADTSDTQRALGILRELEKTYRIDSDRFYLTGISMGGFGAWSLAAADPDRWAALAPISGGGDPNQARRVADLPIWAFHGAADRVVPSSESRRMVEAIQAAGGRPRYDEFPSAGHNVWDRVYRSDGFYDWLFAQRRGRRAEPDAGGGLRAPAIAPEREIPFVPALEIPHAVYVRLGSEMLAALADSIPYVVPADALSGSVPDIQTRTTAEGMAVTVVLRGIRYSGRLTRAVLEPRSLDRIAVTLVLRDVNLWIQGTQIYGDFSATAGPIRIVLGHRSDLPISFEVRPRIVDRRLRLELLNTQFRLPRDNWSVGAPQWVNASGGLFVTDERVASGLRRGLAGDPGRIEREMVAAIPRMVAQLEERLALEPVDRVVANLWPLPVYQPRLRSWPSAVHVDESGATIALGISVAADDPGRAPASPRQVDLNGSDVSQSLTGERFRFGFNPQLLEPLALQMVDDDAARAHISDMPMQRLQPLGDPDTLAEIAPDLKRHGDVRVRAELRLAGPLRLERGQGDAADAIVFELPRVRCSIRIQPRRSTEWIPFLEIDSSVRHAARPSVERRTPNTRTLALDWLGDAAIDAQARFADGYEASDTHIDRDRIRDLLAAGWHEWTAAESLAQMPLDDIDLGFSKLRADSVGWDGPYLAARFGPAGLLIQNRTKSPIAYKMKGPYSEWGGPYQLEPDAKHEYGIAYPVTCRFQGQQGEREYTLGPGTRFEFLAPEDGSIDLYESRDVAPASEKSTVPPR